MGAWFYSLLSTLAVSLVSLIGLLTLSLKDSHVRWLAPHLVSFAVGTLLGDAFIHLIPESFIAAGSNSLGPSLLVLVGMLLFFTLEKLLCREYGSLPTLEAGRPRRELIALNVVGDTIHNFIDGVLVCASYLVSPALGVSTTIAVICHEIPQELADFGILVQNGSSVRRAVVVNLLSSAAAVLGTLTLLLVGEAAGPAMSKAFVPVTAGGFIYIASAGLIPELRRDRSLRALLVQVTLISSGIATMAALRLLE